MTAAWGLAWIGGYAVLIGVASFIETPLGRGFRSVELNVCIRAGSLVVALVGLVAAHGLALPATGWAAGAVGIGLLTGVGSILYCIALIRLPIALVVTLSNLYLVVTVALGVVVLHEAMSPLTVAALACTLAGVVLLARPPASRYAVHSAESVAEQAPRLSAFLPMAVYVVIVGIGAFLEKPALRSLDPIQLNAFVAIGMTVAAVLMVVREGRTLPISRNAFAASGVGAMIGVASIFYFLGLRTLPLTVAAATSNANVLVTVALAATFQGRRLSPVRSLAIGLTLVGVTLLASSTVL